MPQREEIKPAVQELKLGDLRDLEGMEQIASLMFQRHPGETLHILKSDAYPGFEKGTVIRIIWDGERPVRADAVDVPKWFGWEPKQGAVTA